MLRPLLAGAAALAASLAVGGAAQATIVNQHMTPHQLTSYCRAVGAASSSTTISLPGGRLVHGMVQCASGAVVVFCGEDDHDRRRGDDDCYLIQGGQILTDLEHHHGGDDDGHRSRRHGGDHD